MTRRYFHCAENMRFKVKIMYALPYQINNNYKRKWVTIPIPKRISIVFTPRYLLIKKYNKKIISIPYNDIESWGNYNNRWSFRWMLTTETVIYKNSQKFERYFLKNDRCILYIVLRGKNNVSILNNTMNKYKSEFHKKMYIWKY